MIVDITGTILTPGNLGLDCVGNGFHKVHACCCDECDYLLCCTEWNWKLMCVTCREWDCPRQSENNLNIF